MTYRHTLPLFFSLDNITPPYPPSCSFSISTLYPFSLSLFPYYHPTCKISIDLDLLPPPFHPITSNIIPFPPYSTYASLLSLLLATFPHHSFHSSTFSSLSLPSFCYTYTLFTSHLLFVLFRILFFFYPILSLIPLLSSFF